MNLLIKQLLPTSCHFIHFFVCSLLSLFRNKKFWEEYPTLRPTILL
jgi:hypothetical protein